jgi:hypothetical protein
MTTLCGRVFSTVLCLAVLHLVAGAQAPSSKTKKPKQSKLVFECAGCVPTEPNWP